MSLTCDGNMDKIIGEIDVHKLSIVRDRNCEMGKISVMNTSHIQNVTKWSKRFNKVYKTVQGKNWYISRKMGCMFPAHEIIGFFSLRHRLQTGSEAPSSTYAMSIGGGLQRPGREGDYSPPSSREVKNAWSYTSTPPPLIHGLVVSWVQERYLYF
jgi:hypothetical protein